MWDTFAFSFSRLGLAGSARKPASECSMGTIMNESGTLYKRGLRTEDLERRPLLLRVPVGKVLGVRWASVLGLDLLGNSGSAGCHLQLSDVACDVVDGFG